MMQFVETLYADPLTTHSQQAQLLSHNALDGLDNSSLGRCGIAAPCPLGCWYRCCLAHLYPWQRLQACY